MGFYFFLFPMATLDVKKSKKKKSSKRKDAKSSKKDAFTIPYIDPDEINLKGLLGKGCFGKVYSGECRSIEVAVKIPKKQKLSKRALVNFTKEVEIMSKIYHPNVCLFMGACIEPGQIRIVSEKLETDLDNKIHDMTEDIPLTQRIQWAKETCQGIAWLHGSEPPIVHRDLKPANMLLDEHNKIKVCDFGLSHFMEDGLYDKEPKGTPLYMAPEVMRKEEISEKVDVYSVGVITWELLTREDPFADHEDYQTFVDAVCNDNERPIIPRWCPDSLRKIITSCWEADPNARPTMAEVILSLDSCIQDCAELDFSHQIDKLIKDKNGRKFWKKCFPSKLTVGWTEFSQCFFKELGLAVPEDPRMKPLSESATDNDLKKAAKDQLKAYAKINAECSKKAKAELSRRSKGTSGVNEMYRLLADDSEMNDELRKVYALKSLINADISDLVSVDEFGKLLERLGPLEMPATGSDCFMDRVEDLTCKPWFHGEVATKQAENMLRVSRSGTFLVRFSNSSRNSYCISSVSKSKKVKHVPIPYKCGVGVELLGDKFSSICELIEEKATSLHLLEPVPNSKYAWLYATDAAPVIGYGVDDS